MFINNELTLNRRNHKNIAQLCFNLTNIKLGMWKMKLRKGKISFSHVSTNIF